MRDFRATKKYRGDVAASYDERRAVKDVTRRDQAIVENYLSKIAPGSSVLDIPAGTGRFIQFCVNRGLRYTGVDISADMLDVARTKVPAGATNVELRVADARALSGMTPSTMPSSSSSLSGCQIWSSSSTCSKRSKGSRGTRPSSKSR